MVSGVLFVNYLVDWFIESSLLILGSEKIFTLRFCNEVIEGLLWIFGISV